MQAVKDLPVTNWHQALPSVTHHSHGIFNTDGKVGDKTIDHTTIEIIDSLSYRNLILAARTSKTEIAVNTWSSDRGYLTFTFPSEIKARKRVPYLVCVHCLFNLAVSDTKLAEVFNDEESLTNFTDITVTSETVSDKLWLYYKSKKDQMARNLIISTQYFRVSSLFVQTQNHENFELNSTDLTLLVNLTKSKKLTNTWLREVTLPIFDFETDSSPLFSHENSLYTVIKEAVDRYLTEATHDEDSILHTHISSHTSDEHYFKGGLHVPQDAVRQLYDGVASISYLFVVSHQDVLSRAWPCIYVRRSDMQVSLYYVNVELLKVHYSVDRPYFSYSTLELIDDDRTTAYIDGHGADLIPADTRLPPDMCQRVNSVVKFESSDVVVEMNKSIIGELSVILPQLFTGLEVLDNRKPYVGEILVIIAQKPYFFKQSDFVSMVERNDFPNTDVMAKSLKIIGLKAGCNFVIKVNETHSLEGRCEGRYSELTSCTGTFAGNIMVNKSGTADLSLDRPYPSCEGMTNASGCYGKYTDRLKTAFVPVSVKSSADGVFDFDVMTGDIEISSADGVKDGVKAWGKCQEWLNVRTKRGKGVTMHIENINGIEPYIRDMDCKGVMDIDKMECVGEMKAFRCEGKRDKDRNLECVGRALILECLNGGSSYECVDDAPDNRIVSCDVLWNGKECDKNLVHIPVTKTSFASGSCRGLKVGEDKCSGQFMGSYSECDREYSAEEGCPDKKSIPFICSGEANPVGCKGDMTSSFYLDGKWKSSALDVLGKRHDYSTVGSGFFKYSTIEKTSKLNFTFQNDSAKVNSTADCYKSLAITTGVCQGFNLIRTETDTDDYEGVLTTRISCNNDFKLNTGECLDGDYTYETCLGDSRPSSDVICNGTYYGIVCGNGADGKICKGEGGTVNETKCTGVWNGYSCKGDHATIYIQINQTDFVAGECDGEYIGNLSCSGNFYNGRMVICNQNPYEQDQFMNACGDNRMIGNCSGLMNGTGCYGYMKGTLTILNESYYYISRGNGHFDFTVIEGITTFTQIERLSDPKSSKTLCCMSNFNPETRTCDQATYTYMNKDSNPVKAGEAEATFWSCPKDTNLDQLICQENATLTICDGSYLDDPKHKMRCLGDLIYKYCARGGNPRECSRDSIDNQYVECFGKYWNGTECLESSSSSARGMKEIGVEIVMVPGEDRKIGIQRFAYEEYTLNNPIVSRIEIWNGTLDKVTLTAGAQSTNGSFHNLVLNQRNNFITMKNGKVVSIQLIDLQLDNINFAELQKNQSCEFVQITFKTLKLVDAVIQDLQTANCTIDQLIVGNAHSSNFLYDDFDFSMGLMNISLYNVTVNLPIINTNKITSSLSDNRPSTENDIMAENMPFKIQSFRLKLLEGGDLSHNNFLEFPVYEANNISLDGLRIGNFILASRQLNRQNSEPIRKKTAKS